MIDGGVLVGRDPSTGVSASPEDLRRMLDRHGVDQALIASYRAIYHDVREGNAETGELAVRYPDRFIPVGLVNPAYYGQAPLGVLRWMRDELGFRVVALLGAPSYHAVNWRAPVVRAIGRAAADLGVALQAGIADVDDLAAVAGAWGGLDVPVMIRWIGGHRYAAMASEVAVAAESPNFFFDVGNAVSIGGLERLVSLVGADRLFFASNSPHHIAECSHAVFRDAALSPGARALIADGTLRGLLRLGAPPHAATSAEGARASAIRTAPKVDVHWHPDGWNLGEPSLAVEAQLATFDRYAYDRVVMFSVRALNGELTAGNAAVDAWTRRDPRVFGMVAVDPLQPDESAGAIERYAAQPRFVGIKTIQDLSGIGLDADVYRPILDRAAELGLPVLAHLGGLAAAARERPDTIFIAAHANWGRARAVLDRPNVYFDFSTSHALAHEMQLERFIRAAGVERVLFGSDGPLVSPAWSLAKLEATALGEDDLALVLHDNAYRILLKLKET